MEYLHRLHVIRLTRLLSVPESIERKNNLTFTRIQLNKSSLKQLAFYTKLITFVTSHM